MSCTVTEIKAIRKNGPMITFDLSDGSCVKYDLQSHKTIGKQGGYVSGLGSQLCGALLMNEKNKFEDQGFYQYLLSLMHVGGRSAYTIAAVLKRCVHYQAKEGYARLGIKVYGNIRTPVSELPRDMLKWITAKDRIVPFTLSQTYIDSWIENREVFQAMLSQRETLYKNTFDKLIVSMLDSLRYGNTRNSAYFQLIDEYRCEPTALARYLVTIDTREGVEISSGIYLLRDYHKMQKTMVQGYHRYEKYPAHLMFAHHLVQRNYSRLCASRFSDEEFSKTYNNNLEMTMSGYDFVCPHCVAQIKDEAVQQQHCVASYIDNVLRGDCHIVFMRRHNDPDRSVITLEVINGKVNHAAGQYNREPTEDEWKVIADYERFIPDDYKNVSVKKEEKHAV